MLPRDVLSHVVRFMGVYDVEEGRYQGQPGGQQVDGENEDDLTSQDHCETEGQCCRWRYFSRRQWSVTSATHDGIDIAFQIVVEHAGPPADSAVPSNVITRIRGLSIP